MNTLAMIIYDNTGFIWLISYGGSDFHPNGGVQYLFAEIPAGKRPASVEVETRQVVLEDIPKTPEQLRLAALEARQDELSVDTDYRLLLLENGLI